MTRAVGPGRPVAVLYTIFVPMIVEVPRFLAIFEMQTEPKYFSSGLWKELQTPLGGNVATLERWWISHRRFMSRHAERGENFPHRAACRTVYLTAMTAEAVKVYIGRRRARYGTVMLLPYCHKYG